MNTLKQNLACTSLLALSVTATAWITTPAYGREERQAFDIPSQSVDMALIAFSRQSGKMIVAPPELIVGKRSREVRGVLSSEEAISILLSGSGLLAMPNPNGGYLIERMPIRSKRESTVSDTARLQPANSGGTGMGGDPGTGAGVDEIIVTAQRRAERLEDVPLAVISVTPEALENASVTALQDLGKISPGVQINYSARSVQPAIRGVSTLTQGSGQENNVAVYYDGFYQPNALSLSGDLSDISSIEILKGPQGTLYGRNATGGAILINSREPSEILTGRMEVTYARFNDWRVSGFLSGPVSERVRFSLAGYYRNSDGYIKLVDPVTIGKYAGNAAPLEQGLIRAKLEFDITDNLTATAAFNYVSVDSGNTILFSGFDHIPPTAPDPPARATKLGTAAYNRKSVGLQKNSMATLKLAWKSSFGTVTSYTGYGEGTGTTKFDFDGTYRDDVYLTFGNKENSFQQALDVTVGNINNIDLVFGGLYFRNNIYMPDGDCTTVHVANLTPVRVSCSSLKTDALAFYGDATAQLSDRLVFNFGGRFSYEKRRAGYSVTSGTGAVIFPSTIKTADFQKFTPRASLRYEIAPRTNVYATFSTGFRSGTFSPSGADTPANWLPIKPENITAYELGLKSASRKFRLDVAAFYYDYKNLQVSVSIPNPSCAPGQTCGPVTLFSNTPKAEIYGIDGAFTWKPTEQLTLRAGGAWLHARYRSFPNATATGISAAGLNVTQPQDWYDQEMARSPEFSGNIGADYETGLASGKLLLSANIAYTDGYVISNPSLYGPLAPPDLMNRQRFRNSSFTLVSASAKWTDPTDHFWLSVFGTNLANETYRLTYNGGTSGDYSTKAEPRSYGVRAGYKF